MRVTAAARTHVLNHALRSMRHVDILAHIAQITREERRSARADEPFGIVAPLSACAGLTRLRVEHEILPPGRRSSSPHAHTAREEVVYVISGTPDLWLDGELHPMKPGDCAVFAAGTGLAHAVLNNSDTDAEMLVIATLADDDVCFYPFASEPSALPAEVARAWAVRPRGPHEGIPATKTGDRPPKQEREAPYVSMS